MSFLNDSRTSRESWLHEQWKATTPAEDIFEGRSRATGDPKWVANRVELVFGSNSQLRAIADI